MSKITRRWIELNTGSPDHLRASDIPATTGTIQTELDAGLLKVSAADTIKGLLQNKVVAGSNVSIAVVNDVILGDQLQISSTASGGSSISSLHNETARYQVLSTANLGVSCTSTSPLIIGLSWQRLTTSLTIYHTGHGRSVGDRVIVRDTNMAYQVGVIAGVTANAFSITTTDTGGLTGADCAYGLGFTYAHNAASGSITGGTLTAPANGNVVLQSLRIHLAANTRSTTTYNVTVPKSAYNGAGDNTSSDDLYPPLFMVRNDTDAMAAIAATIAKNVGADLGTFQLANLGAVTTGLLIMFQF